MSCCNCDVTQDTHSTITASSCDLMQNLSYTISNDNVNNVLLYKHDDSINDNKKSISGTDTLYFNNINTNFQFLNDDNNVFANLNNIDISDSWYNVFYYDNAIAQENAENVNLINPIESLNNINTPNRHLLALDNSIEQKCVKKVLSTADVQSTSEGEYNSRQMGKSLGKLRSSINVGRYLKCDYNPATELEQHNIRPELNEKMIDELNDISQFKMQDKLLPLIVDYTVHACFPLGEGGRELLRACLNIRGCKGRQLQGASVPVLLQLAHKYNLWNVAIRIRLERSIGVLSPAHEAFVKFKASQSQMRKYVRKEYMVTERDRNGRIKQIVYDESRKITLGKEGREALRAQLRRLHDKHASRMDELLEQNGFKYTELRNATVHQLSRMAFVCNIWDQVVGACRSQEEKKDGQKRRKNNDLNLPYGLMKGQTPPKTKNGKMSNEDAMRTMQAVNELLQNHDFIESYHTLNSYGADVNIDKKGIKDDNALAMTATQIDCNDCWADSVYPQMHYDSTIYSYDRHIPVIPLTSSSWTI